METGGLEEVGEEGFGWDVLYERRVKGKGRETIT